MSNDDNLKERIDKFMSRPDYPKATRHNLSKAYHPDVNPPELRDLCNDIMKDVNRLCDELDKEKKGK